MTPVAAFVTLGCRLNTADTALLTDRLERCGYRIVEMSAETVPDLIVVNSCAVTAEAERKSRQITRQLRERYPNARIVVTGCGAESGKEKFEADGAANAVLHNRTKREIDVILGNMPEPEIVPETVFQEHAFGKFPFLSRAFLKIQEGCENFCTYCIVPYVRGPERSRDFEEVIADCRQALAQGFPELVLTGVNTAAYCHNGRTLSELLKRVCDLPGDFRVRLSSTEPHPHNQELLELMRDNPKICRFLHLSLQHGSDRILKRMNRHYTAAQFADFAAAARSAVPGISLGTDVIAGFPGETEEDFAESLELIRKLSFANTHLFRYSPRPGTPAATYPDQVPAAISKERFLRLKEVTDRSRQDFVDSWIGKTIPVVFEEEKADGFRYGWSDHYIRVRMPADAVELNRIVPVLFTENCRVSGGEANA